MGDNFAVSVNNRGLGAEGPQGDPLSGLGGWPRYRCAIASISTSAPIGSAEISTVDRAGGEPPT